MQISRLPSSSELVVTPERQNTFGAVQWPSNSNYTFATTSTTAVDATNANFVSSSGTYFGGAKASATANVYGMKMENIPVGVYRISVKISTHNQSGSSDCTSELHNNSGLIGSSQSSIQNNSWNNGGKDIVAIYRVTSVQASQDFKVKLRSQNVATTCSINASNGGTTNPSIVFEPLDQPSNSALYVQGPVKAAATGAAIPAGYVGEVIEATDNGARLQSSPTLNTWYAPWGGAINVPAGTWLICYSATVSANQNSALNAGAVMARIRNLTDATTFMDQSVWATYDATSSTAQVQGYGGGVSGCRTVTITATKTYQLQVSVKAIWLTPTYTAGYVGIRGDFSTTYVKATRLN